MFKIGSHHIENPYILAPMAGVSQMPFRRLALRMGAGLAPTELVSAKGLLYESARTKSYLTYDESVEKPFCVQLFGGEAEAMAVAAEKALAMGAQIIDINMGCPVKKVTKINAGSALLCDWQRAVAIVSAMLKSTNYQIPITAKIRSGWDTNNLNFLEVGKALEEAGISAIALHARTRAQGYSGKAAWDHIAQLKSHLAIPVIGNGDVISKKDAENMRNQTGCDAVMVGRAALGNPWIFKSLSEAREFVVAPQERWLTIKEHLEAHLDLNRLVSEQEKRPFCDLRAIHSFRSHLIWYSKGLFGGSHFRNKVMSSDSVIETIDLIDEFFSQAKPAHEVDNGDDGINYAQAFG
jgi:tRNA-dihydrouridine synthase B